MQQPPFIFNYRMNQSTTHNPKPTNKHKGLGRPVPPALAHVAGQYRRAAMRTCEHRKFIVKRESLEAASLYTAPPWLLLLLVFDHGIHDLTARN